MRALIIVSLVYVIVLIVQHALSSPIYGSKPRGRSRSRSGSRSSASSRSSDVMFVTLAYHVPSKTLSRITELVSSGANRARIRVPPASLSSPVRLTYARADHLNGPDRDQYSNKPISTPIIDNYLYRNLSWLGCDDDTDPYVPFKRQYSDYLTTPVPATPKPNPRTLENINESLAVLNASTMPGDLISSANASTMDIATTTHTLQNTTKTVDLCTLIRWNRELHFAEVPNMFLSFISDDNVSGTSAVDKERFTYEFFEQLFRVYSAYNSSWDVFAVPVDSDVDACNMDSVEEVDFMDDPAGNAEEPILTAVRNMITLYTNASKLPYNLPDVVAAAKACLPEFDKPAWWYDNVLPCLDFSSVPDQRTTTNLADSMFGNDEICREHLNHDLFRCEPFNQAVTCRLSHLVALNVFARNYYLCPTELEDGMVRRIRLRMMNERKEHENWMSDDETTPNSTGITNGNQINTTFPVLPFSTDVLQLNITVQ